MSNDIKYGHVKPESEVRYRKYRNISRDFEDLGDKLGAQHVDDANVCYALALKYRHKANQSRVIISNESSKDYDHRLTVEDLRRLKSGDRLQMWDPTSRDILHATVGEGEVGYLNLIITNTNAGDVTELNIHLKNLVLDDSPESYRIRHFNPAFDPETKNV